MSMIKVMMIVVVIFLLVDAVLFWWVRQGSQKRRSYERDSQDSVNIVEGLTEIKHQDKAGEVIRNEVGIVAKSTGRVREKSLSAGNSSKVVSVVKMKSVMNNKPVFFEVVVQIADTDSGKNIAPWLTANLRDSGLGEEPAILTESELGDMFSTGSRYLLRLMMSSDVDFSTKDENKGAYARFAKFYYNKYGIVDVEGNNMGGVLSFLNPELLLVRNVYSIEKLIEMRNE